MSDGTPLYLPRGRPLILATMALAAANFVVVLDTTIANVSVPHIAGSLGVSSSQAAWTITAYAVADAITVLLAGWLAMRFGAIRAFTGALMGFGAFSVLCGLSPTIEMLVIARIGQGMCGGPLIPLSQALLMRIYPPETRAKGSAIWSSTTLLAPVLGPVFGGLISDGLSWHWIFLINIPVVIGCILSVTALLKGVENEPVDRPIDRVGFALMVLGIGALQLVLDLGREHDWFGDPTVLGLAIVAAIALAAFVIWELTAEHPLVDLRVFRHYGYTIGMLCFTMGFGTYYAGVVVIPQWMQVSLGYTATQAGLATCVTGLAAIAMTTVPARLAHWMDARLIISIGILWMGGATIMRSSWTSEVDFWQLLLPQFLMGFAFPLCFTTLIFTSFAQVPPREMATAAGLFAFMRTTGLAFGTSLSLTFWDSEGRVAGSELAGSLHSDATSAALAANGFSIEQSREFIAQLVHREAVTLATDKIFLASGVATCLMVVAIWFIPLPKKPGMGAPADAH